MRSQCWRPARPTRSRSWSNNEEETTMKALVFEEPRSASVQELDVPSVAADEVLVRSRNVGICHSDFELYEGRYIIPVSYPIVPGHEWSGEVAEVGSAVTSLRPSDRVVGECVVNNGDDHFGFSIGGADAEYFVAKASWLHRIPDELSFAHGAFVEPFSVAYNATVAAGGIDASDSVAVIGGGRHRGGRRGRRLGGGPSGLFAPAGRRDEGGTGDVNRAAAPPPLARSRDRRAGGTRPCRRRRSTVRRRHRGSGGAGGDGERIPD